MLTSRLHHTLVAENQACNIIEVYCCTMLPMYCALAVAVIALCTEAHLLHACCSA
jgi:hypothetical protein